MVGVPGMPAIARLPIYSGADCTMVLPLFEIALVLVCLDHIASRIVNASRGIM
jgi:hypothetical protein